MNFKTTFFLLVALLACGVVFWIYRPDPKAIREARLAEKTASAESKVERNLVTEGSLGDIVKVACKARKQSEEWVFEKRRGDDKDIWDITAPLSARASGWQVDNIHRRMLEIRYDIVYPGGEGLSEQQAGLADPEARVTLTDATGKSLTFEIGKSPARGQTYARLADQKDIVVAKADLMSAIKESILDYRDPKLFDFNAADAVRLEITDRTAAAGDHPVVYVLVRDSDGWTFEAPFPGRATADVEAAVTTFANARMTKWKDSDPATLPVYGLDDPALSLAVTVEKKTTKTKPLENPTPAEDSGSDQPETETVVETFVHTLHISRVSPLGEDTMLYARVGDEPAVGTLPKTTTDKFKPIESKWRDMRLTTAPVTRASRVQIVAGGRTTDLIDKDGVWTFADSGEAADGDAVKDLLKAVAGLNARAFVPLTPGKEGEEKHWGLDPPDVDIVLTLPGQDAPERLRIGGPSDGELKRLYYVRRGESMSVAKVRTEDLKLLRRPPTDYRSRQVFSLSGGSIERIELSYDNPVDEGRVSVVLENQSGKWVFVEPIEAPASKERTDKLIQALKNIRAVRFVSHGAEWSKYGLEAPAATLRMMYREPSGDSAAEEIETRKRERQRKAADPGESAEGVEPEGGPDARTPQEADQAADDLPLPATAGETQRGSQRTLELLAGSVSGQYYLKRGDAPAVYEIDKDLFDRFQDEYRDDRVLTFTESEVVEFSIRGGTQTHVFRKQNDQWILTAEPDLTLDQKAVSNLLVNLSDLRTGRYVRYTDADLGAYGLGHPAHEATLILDDGRKLTLGISQDPCPKDALNRHFASRGDGGVFLLSKEEIARFEVRLDVLEAR